MSVVLPSELLAIHTNEPASWRVTLPSVNRGPLATESTSSLPVYQLYEISTGLATAVALMLTGSCSSTKTVYDDIDIANTGLSDKPHVGKLTLLTEKNVQRTTTDLQRITASLCRGPFLLDLWFFRQQETAMKCGSQYI